jgi:hypothetical protein
MSATREIRAGKAFVELALKDRLQRGLNQAAKRLQAFGKTVNRIGAGLLAGSAALATPLAAGVHVFTEWGDQLAKMSQRTGISVASLSELTHAAQQSGASVEELENAIKLLQKNLLAAAGGSKSATRALSAVGLSVDDLVRLDPEHQFLAVADALSKVPDPSRRAALALQLLGGAGTRLLPMLADGLVGIEALREEARRLGLAMSDADAQMAVRLGDALANLGTSVKMLAFQIGAALAPTLLQLVRFTLAAASGLIRLVREHRVAVVAMAALAAIVATGGGLLVAFGSSCILVSFALSGLSAMATIAAAAIAALDVVLAVLLSPIVLIVGGVLALVAALAALALWATGLGAKLWNLATSGFGMLVAGAKNAAAGIRDALLGGDIELAAQILLLSLKLAWLHGLHAVEDLLLRFTLRAQSVWEGLMDSLVKAFLSFSGWVQKGWWDVLGLVGGFDPSQIQAGVDAATSAAQATVDQARIGRAAARLGALEANRQANQAEIDQARAELDALLKRAADSRARAEAPFNFDPGQVAIPNLKTVTERLAVSGGGVFNAAAAANLGRTASIEEKMLQALEDIAADTDDLARAAQRGGLVWA